MDRPKLWPTFSLPGGLAGAAIRRAPTALFEQLSIGSRTRHPCQCQPLGDKDAAITYLGPGHRHYFSRVSRVFDLSTTLTSPRALEPLPVLPFSPCSALCSLLCPTFVAAATATRRPHRNQTCLVPFSLWPPEPRAGCTTPLASGKLSITQ